MATNLIIVQKTSTGKENTGQAVQDEDSGWIRSYPITKSDTHTVVKNLLRLKACTMIKSDQAKETRLAAQHLDFCFRRHVGK